jgi:uncharacterized glyoxalase superfamily protein PhnB
MGPKCRAEESERKKRLSSARFPGGGEVTLPPTETFYSVLHAAVRDKLSVNWNVVAVEQSKQMDG